MEKAAFINDEIYSKKEMNKTQNLGANSIKKLWCFELNVMWRMWTLWKPRNTKKRRQEQH